MPAKPTATITPVAPAATSRPIQTVVDERGRQISYRQLSVLEQARLMRAVGADNSANTAFLTVAMFAAMVTDIDGTPQPQAKTLAQVDAAIERLDDEGYQAMAAAMGLVAEANAGDEAATLAAAKN